eukprot:jgi/Tetstr1/456285/TSEL_043042.t1
MKGRRQSLELHRRPEGVPPEALQAALDRLSGGKRPLPAATTANKPAEKAAPGKKPKAKKAGLVATLPAADRPWMKKCIDKWNLCAPYDHKVTEAEWKAYFLERLALDCAFNKSTVTDWAEDNAAGLETAEFIKTAFAERSHDMPRLTFEADWDTAVLGQPPEVDDVCRESYAEEPREEADELIEALMSEVKRVLTTCHKLQSAVPGAAELTSKNVRILLTRIYSPCATGRSVDLSFKWHFRARMSFSEHFCMMHAALRDAGCCGKYPAQICWSGMTKGDQLLLIDMDEKDCGYQKRRFATKPKLNTISEHLFGFTKVVSERKCFSLLVAAAGSEHFGNSADWIGRLSRRKLKLHAGEESDNGSGLDSDSASKRVAEGDADYDRKGKRPAQPPAAEAPSRLINAPEDGWLDKDGKVHRRHTADARNLQRDLDDVFQIYDFLAPAEEPLRDLVEDGTDLPASSPASSAELFKSITAALALCTTVALRINRRGKKLHVEHEYGAEVAKEFDAVDPLGEKGSADNKELKKALEKVKAKKPSSSSSRAKPSSSSRRPESFRRGSDNRRESGRREEKPPSGRSSAADITCYRCQRKALSIVWASRDENPDSDEISKMLDKDDWQLLPKFFRRLSLKWGIHHVDRFASDLNHQVPRFYSRFWCPGCEGVDAFSHFWGAKRTLGLAVKKAKEPFAWSDIAKLVHLRCKDDSGICSWIVAVAAAVSFAGFCRYSDLRVLRWEDVSFLPTYLEFRFVKRKNDQHRLCGKVRVAKMHGAVVCVYGLLRRYQAVMIRWATPTLPVFPGFSGTVLRHKGELGMVPSSSPIEYPTFRRYLARWLGPLLTPAMTESAFLSRFGTQSSRSGGASAAANADIPFATWGQHGGWKSTSAQLRYMGLDEEHVLSVSRAILSLAEEDELDDGDGDGSPSDTDSNPSRQAT